MYATVFTDRLRGVSEYMEREIYYSCHANTVPEAGQRRKRKIRQEGTVGWSPWRQRAPPTGAKDCSNSDQME